MCPFQVNYSVQFDESIQFDDSMQLDGSMQFDGNTPNSAAQMLRKHPKRGDVRSTGQSNTHLRI